MPRTCVASKLSEVMRRLALIAALVTAGCYWNRARPVLAANDLETLESQAGDELGCKEVKIRPRTLLTRVVEGCGQSRIYAWDAMREEWVVAP